MAWCSASGSDLPAEVGDIPLNEESELHAMPPRVSDVRCKPEMLHDTYISIAAVGPVPVRRHGSESRQDLVLEEAEALPRQLGRDAAHQWMEGDEGEGPLFAQLGHHLVRA